MMLDTYLASADSPTVKCAQVARSHSHSGMMLLAFWWTDYSLIHLQKILRNPSIYTCQAPSGQGASRASDWHFVGQIDGRLIFSKWHWSSELKWEWSKWVKCVNRQKQRCKKKKKSFNSNFKLFKFYRYQIILQSTSDLRWSQRCHSPKIGIRYFCNWDVRGYFSLCKFVRLDCV